VVLDRLAFKIGKGTRIKGRVKGAMMYPLMVMGFATLVLVGMLMFLVPIFVDIFAELGGDLPMLTQIVVKMSNVLRSYYFIVFPLMGLSIYGFFRLKKTEQGRRVWDGFRMRIPFGVGASVVKVGMARVPRTAPTPTAGGAPAKRRRGATNTPPPGGGGGRGGPPRGGHGGARGLLRPGHRVGAAAPRARDEQDQPLVVGGVDGAGVDGGRVTHAEEL